MAAAFAATAAIAMVPAGAARGAAFTYAGEGVPQTIGEGQTATSTATVPPGFGAAVDVDVVSLGLTAVADATDQTVILSNPAGLQRLIVNSGCVAYPGGSSFTLDQQAQTSPFGGAGTCPPGTGTYRPSNSPASTMPLTDLLGPSAGTWTLTYSDGGDGGSGGTLGSWGLRISHAPIKLTAKRKKRQVINKRARITALCNAECTLRVGGDAKRLAIPLQGGVSRSLSLPIKAGALARTREGGKLRIELTATGRFGEVDERELRISVVPPPARPPAVCGARDSAVAAC